MPHLTSQQKKHLIAESRRVHPPFVSTTPIRPREELPICGICNYELNTSGETAETNWCGHSFHCSCLNSYKNKNIMNCHCGQPLTICGRRSSGGKRTRISKSKSRRTKSKTRRRKSRK